jgi:hypothetical protein
MNTPGYISLNPGGLRAFLESQEHLANRPLV